METQEPRVLLVEDDPLTRESLAYILEIEGYRVSTAEDGKQGLELLHRSLRPDVVLLDLDLPVVNGTSFYGAKNRIRRLPISRCL